jgi:hypothetical protein
MPGVTDIPQLNRAVSVAAGQRAAIAAEGHRVHSARIAAEHGLRKIPQPERAIVAAAGQGMPVTAEGH